MARKALAVHVGAEAAGQIAERGWNPDLFSLLLGASGGPKWFILGHLDRMLFGDFLQGGSQPLSTLGSSIGAWRNACLVQPDPVAAIDRMEQGYLHQQYASARPGPEEVSTVSRAILQSMLGETGSDALVTHPRINSQIVTARGRGAAASRSSALLATGMGAAALGNTVSRTLLRHHFQRVVFHAGSTGSPGLSFNDFNTRHCTLTPEAVLPALHASGAIPFVLSGERDIPGAPRGQYWDGGIIDYHFDLSQYQGEGLMLYPHFRAGIVPGWFDKFLPWRQRSVGAARKLVLLCPDENFVATLPHGKIPDRNDFNRFDPQRRVRYWQQCIDASAALAGEFADLLAQDDPLAGVVVHS
ncbi:patatin-like phospholipase family protein [Seongchinamella unica]|uniref:Patatin-like phospholipase family protein n=1 Tax=Seongchinamella unica TaxID=2547392 RepID=A0A4R5LPU1_9GAMM|nr:patatin-like phospholipase family protein [Seongchinamella unica]TDG12548.1 patatin-like phospholipase family protein [Seongchinamella unica]